MTNLVWEVPVFTELQPEMWDLDSKADETPMPEKFTTYQGIQSEDWDVDDEVQVMPTVHPSCLEFLTDPKAQRFLDLYSIGNLLGSGGFGSVYEGVRRKDGQQVAVKHIRKDGSELYITALAWSPLPGQHSADQPETSGLALASSPAVHGVNIPAYRHTEPPTWGEINNKTDADYIDVSEKEKSVSEIV
ncbi:hypothetical protein KOW79_007064 [Hemibagrus wyckioides]|uniref:non-specific serine/threonine protein kinase n=1 Tax=Hemibagrus wyckioides TaxID=337641 RepID=A0A9D3NXC1_9TELE|nr:hypothetical protein KOW79_007064 [Hemibagrus wyckioides]